MPATEYPIVGPEFVGEHFGYWPLWEYYRDRQDIAETLPHTSADPASPLTPGASDNTLPRNNLTRPHVPTNPDLALLHSTVDSWGREVQEWATSTFPLKMEGVTGGKVSTVCAPDGSLVFETHLPRYPHCTIIQPRDPVNFLRAYILPEEERHNTIASRNLTLGPSTLVVRVLLWDYDNFDPEAPTDDPTDPPGTRVAFRLPYAEERFTFDWWAWCDKPASGYGWAPFDDFTPG